MESEIPSQKTKLQKPKHTVQLKRKTATPKSSRQIQKGTRETINRASKGTKE